MLADLVQKNRSYRRFDQNHPVTGETLRELVALARLTPSAANRQPLKYLFSWKPEQNAVIFPHTKWAGYLTEWPGPAEGERPTAYIIILGDKEISESYNVDPGIVAQTMLLGAAEKDLGGCMIGTFDRDGVRRACAIPERYELLLILALGKPQETVVIDSVAADGGIKYWRDADSVHHVPKRALDELIVTF